MPDKCPAVESLTVHNFTSRLVGPHGIKDQGRCGRTLWMRKRVRCEQAERRDIRVLCTSWGGRVQRMACPRSSPRISTAGLAVGVMQWAS